MKRILTLLAGLSLFLPLLSARQITSLNQGWQFKKGNLNVWGVYPDIRIPATDTTVNLPHTWNASDFMSDHGYYRGEGTYLKELDIPESWRGKRIFVRFEGASSFARVDVNWKTVAIHKGGYNSFTVELTDALTYGAKNYLIVTCDNSPRYDIAPLGGDFNIYGGLYRDVWLEVTEKRCISPLYFGSNGLFVTQRYLDDAHAELGVQVLLSSPDGYDGCEVSVRICDAEGNCIAEQTTPYIHNDKATFTVSIDQPHRWNGMEDPYLYKVYAILQQGGEELDRMEDTIGLRTFYLDPDKGFFLNGKHVKLRGVSRHQDWAGIASALKKENHLKDLDIIQEMGVNALRLAHYPQAHFMFHEADRRGFVVWEEIPFISSYFNVREFDENLILQLQEMIFQNYNRPSICFWGLFNEVMADFCPILSTLNDIAHQIDPGRITVAATFRDGAYNFITDGIAWNKYFGWYDSGTHHFGQFFDQWHAAHPAAKLAVSEYGAGSGLSQHVAQYDDLTSDVRPNGRFHPMEKQTFVHREHLRMIEERDYLWGSFVWNMFDFASSNRREGEVNNTNDKGLVSQDRMIRKDAYYLYKANWNREERTVWLCSKGYTNRKEELTDVIVFTTAPTATLFLNGKKIGTRKTDNHATVEWKNIRLRDGSNHIEIQTPHGNDSADWSVRL